MSTSTLRQGARGGGVTLLAQAVRLIIQFVGVIALSRLLTPADFGLVAMVAVFMTLADLVRDFGLPSAALQARELSHQQASNLFWASLTLATFSGGALIAATPLIVAIYEEPRLSQIVPAMAIAIFVSGVQAQIQIQLARAMRFATLAITATAAPAAGLVIAIVAASSGLGYWALVLQPVCAAVTLLALQAAAARWVPTLPRRGFDSSALFIAGMQLGASYSLTWAASNVDTLVTGIRWGATNTGYYNRGYQLTVMPVSSILSPLTQVAVPMLNAAVREGRRASDLLLRLQFMVAAPIAALMTTIALTAPSVVPLLLGPEWAPIVPIVQILAFGECIHALSFVSYWGFLAERLPKQLLYYNLVTKPIAIACVIVGSPFGIVGIALGYVAGLAISWPINLAWLARTAQYPAGNFFARGARILTIAALAYLLGVAVLWSPLQDESWLAVFAGAGIVFTASIAAHFAFHQGRQDLRKLLQTVRALR